MKYDLIVAGGGPGGLMAALTAARDGMKVVLVERRKRIGDFTTACLQILYVKPISQLFGGKTYNDPITVEMGASATRFHNINLGFTLEYGGQLKPYLNWLHVSPGGHAISRFEPGGTPWGFFYQKDVFCRELYEQALAAGVEVRLATMAESAENTATGVRLSIRDEGGRATLEADNLIAADGVASHVADSLGMGAQRRVLAAARGGAAYICGGLESPFPGNSLLAYTVPSLTTMRNIVVGVMDDALHRIGGLKAKWPEIVSHPTFAPLLGRASLVKKQAWSFDVRTPLSNPVCGNTVVVGDAAAPAETWIMGAVACGYQAVRAIQKERVSSPGYADYCTWWQGAFAFNRPDYFAKVSDHYIFNRVCTDAEIDVLFGLFRDKVGIPGQLIAANMDLIAAASPEIHAKLLKAGEANMWQK